MAKHLVQNNEIMKLFTIITLIQIDPTGRIMEEGCVVGLSGKIDTARKAYTTSPIQCIKFILKAIL